MVNDKLARAARWYARHGWYVVPVHTPRFDDNGDCVGCSCEDWRRRKEPTYVCHTPGKHPRLADWEANASADVATVAEWWRRWPDANIGIAAGRSGILTFDLDSYKDDYEGDKLLEPADIETVTSLTGSGGSHLIYTLPPDALYTNARGALPRGIDIRAHGGQFVAPPSIHPSGRAYQWELEYGPHEIEPLPLPTHIAAILDAHKGAQLAPPKFSADETLDKPALDRWQLSQRVRLAIETAPTVGKRSELDQSVISALIMAGASNDEIRAVFEHYPIGAQGKYHDKGAHRLNYLAHSVARARAWAAGKIEERTAATLATLAVR
jgi:hypothetical protein